MENKTYKIWTSYHDENLVDKYNLVENDIIKLFNTSNMECPGNNLNHLNKFFSEGCCLLYPYLNNLKSDYIGFMHYRRGFDYNNVLTNYIDQGYIQYFHYHQPIDEIKKHREEYGITKFDYKTSYKNLENHCFFWSMDKCGIIDELIEFLGTRYPQYLINEKEIHRLIWCSIFVCNWDIYQELAKFIYDYLTYLNNKYKLYWDENLWKKYVEQRFLEYNQLIHPKDPEHVYCKRVEDDGSVWCELPFWGDKGWTTCDYENGYINSLGKKSNLYRVYSYNIEFLVSVFIYNHKSIIDMDNVLYFKNEDQSISKIPFDIQEY